LFATLLRISESANQRISKSANQRIGESAVLALVVELGNQ